MMSPEDPPCSPAPETDAEADFARAPLPAGALDAAEALLGNLETAPRPTAPPEGLFEMLEAQVLVAVVDLPVSAEAFPEAALVEPIGVGHTGLATDDPAGDDTAARALLGALTRLPADARIAVAWAPGRVTPRGVLGEAPSLALEAHARHLTPGVYLDASARVLASGPLATVGQDFQMVAARVRVGRPRRMLWAGLLAASLVGVLLPVLLPDLLPAIARTAAPHGTLTVLGERAAVNAARGSVEPLTLTEGDGVRAVLTAEKGTYVTLVVFDSEDRLVLPPERGAVNQRATELQSRWALDATPGTEQILAVIARSPWPDADAVVDTINARGDLTRAARLEALDTALANRLPGEFRLIRGAEIRHVSR